MNVKTWIVCVKWCMQKIFAYSSWFWPQPTQRTKVNMHDIYCNVSIFTPFPNSIYLRNNSGEMKRSEGGPKHLPDPLSLYWTKMESLPSLNPHIPLFLFLRDSHYLINFMITSLGRWIDVRGMLTVVLEMICDFPPWLVALLIHSIEGAVLHQSVVRSVGLPGGPVVKNSPVNTGDMSSIPGLGRSHMLDQLSPCAIATESSL